MTMKFSKNGEDNETLQHTTHVDKLDVAIDYTYPQRKISSYSASAFALKFENDDKLCQ